VDSRLTKLSDNHEKAFFTIFALVLAVNLRRIEFSSMESAGVSHIESGKGG
jgi:hypothetical protein